MNKQTKNVAVILLVSGGIVLGSATFGFFSQGFAQVTNGEENAYSLSLNNSTCPLTISSGSGYGSGTATAKTSLGNSLSFAGSSIMKKTNYLAQIKASVGSFYNVSAITGMISLSVTFSTSSADSTGPTLYFGTESNPSGNSVSLGAGSSAETSKTYTVSNSDFPSGCSYFKLAAGAKATFLKSIDITYSCTLGPATVRSLSIADTASRYKVGDVYSESSTLSVLANYTDGKSIAIPFDSKGENGYTLTGLNENGDDLDGVTAFQAKDVGTALFEANYNGMKSTNTSEIVIYNPSDPVAVTSVSFGSTTGTIYVDDEKSFVASVTPAYANDISLTYESSKPSVATIDQNGLVKGISEGTTVLTATSPDGPSASLTLTVALETGFAKKSVAYTAKDVDSSYAPSSGNQKILAIPVHLKSGDYSWDADKLNTVNTNLYGTGTDSLVSYYKRASYSQLLITGEVAGTMSKMYQSTYSQSDLSTSDETANMNKLYSLISGAVSWAGSTYGINLDDYDSDDDGYIDSVHFFLDGNDNNNWGSALWPHMNIIGNVAKGTKANPVANCYSSSNLGHLGDAVTTIHEQGHIYGLDDYYNYNSNDDESDASDFVGWADMQDYNVFDWNCYSKLIMGWIKPYVVNGLKSETTITLRPTATSGDCILIGNDWNGSAYDEYIIMELFTPVGNNAKDWSSWTNDLGNGGIRLYHVDSRLWGYNSSSLFNSGAVVDDPRTTSYNYVQVANSNSTNGSYSTQPSSFSSSFHLLDLIQAGGTNTFSKTSSSVRHTLNKSDLFATGNTFTIGTHTGYKDYGSAFFGNKTKMNDGSTFNYGISFVSVASDQATVKITKF